MIFSIKTSSFQGNNNILF